MDKNCVLIWIGLILTTTGTLLSLSWDSIFNFILQKELLLSPTSKSYALWKDTPIPMSLDFYFFNWTNPEELLQDNFKPALVELGPYSFKETHAKVNITWNANRTITYKQKRWWYFDQEHSNGTLDDVITTLNVVTLAGTNVLRYRSTILQVSFSGAVRMTGQKVWVTKKTGELLFEGYSDPLLTMAVKMQDIANTKIPAEKFGWFYGRNGSSEFDGVFNMKTGEDDISQLGVLRHWNYRNRTDFFEAECGQVKGSAGELFSPGQTRDKPLEMFSSDLCRTIAFEYSEDVEVQGVTGYRFELGKRLVDNGTMDVRNQCNCGGQCVPQGALNVTACRHGAPAFVSYPHYLDADPYYRRAVTGMKPDPNLHRFYITLEPKTGIPLEVAARLQINMLLQENSNFPIYNKVPTVFFPMIWFEERATVSPEIAADLKLLLMLPIVGLCCSLGIVLLGIFILALNLLPRILKGENWTLPQNSKRNAADNKPSQIVYSRECIRPLMTCPERVSVTPEEGSPFTDSKSTEVCLK